VAESNNGGEMVSTTIAQIDKNVPVKLVHASRGKATRAEPISAIAEKGHDHHVGVFSALEDELCIWIQGDDSPNRLDAKVWAMTELISSNVSVGGKARIANYASDGEKKEKDLPW
jgi:phage terminase large subunit-like protein